MKSYGVVWPRAGETEIEEFEVPEPGPGELIVEVAYSVISPGTERMRLTNRRNDRTYPFRPGYSVSGRVAAIGPEVEGFRAGDPVVVDAPHAKHVKVRAARVVHVPDGVDLEQAAFFHLGNVALHGARRGQIEIGEAVAVIGQGLVGLLTLQMARLQGGVPVIALDLSESRLEKSRVCGADLVLNPENEAQLNELMASLPGGGPAVVIEATGSGDPINLALRIVRRLGRVVLLGSGSGEIVANFNRDIHRPGVTVIGAQVVGRPAHDSRPGVWTWADDAAAYLELLRRGRLKIEPLITHRFPGSEAAAAYELVKAADPGLIGAVLHW